MQSVVSIANMALMRCGVSRYIDSLDSESVEAQVVVRCIDSVRQRTLRRLPWSFAREVRRLELMGLEFAPWEYSYRYPTDALRIFHLTNREGMGPYVGARVLGESEMITEKYEVAMIDRYKVIGTNLRHAHAVIVVDQPDSSMWDPLFEDLVCWELAREIAAPLAVSGSLAERAANEAQLAYDRARAAALDESRPLDDYVPEFVRCRL